MCDFDERRDCDKHGLGGKLIIIYRLCWAFTGYLHDSSLHIYNEATYIYICQQHFLTAIGKEDAAVDLVHHISGGLLSGKCCLCLSSAWL